jgi:hypothetical protein
MADAVEFLGTFHAGDTFIVEFPIVDQDGVVFKPTDLYLQLYDEGTGSNINGRDGTVNIISSYSDPDQKVIFQAAPADCACLNTKLNQLTETHRLIFRWTWQAGAKEGSRVFNFEVRPRRAAADTS